MTPRTRAALQYVAIFTVCALVTWWGLASSPGPHADVSSPPHAWGSFAPGSWALWHETMRTGGAAIESDERIEVVGRNAEMVELKFETTMTGRPSTVRTRTDDLKNELTAIAAAERVGPETLLIEGRPVSCVVFRRRAGNSEFTFWLSSGFAWPVKSIDSEVVGGVERERKETLLTRFHDGVQIPGRTLRCAVFDEQFRTDGTVVRRATSWRSTEVPGHEARREESFTLNGEPASLSRVIASYGVK